MTAKTTKDGKEIFRDSKIYMPQATDSRGDAMVYGFQKLGLIRDTSLQPFQTRVETFEIRFPYEDIEKVPGGPKIRKIKAKEMDITVELRYQLDPVMGEIDEDSFIFYKTTTKVSIQ